MNTYAMHMLKKYVDTIHTNNDQNIVNDWQTIVCIHICQTYLTELPSFLNPILPLRPISDNLKFCNGLVNFKIMRFNCDYSCIINM
jgi:hypothetical protein